MDKKPIVNITLWGKLQIIDQSLLFLPLILKRNLQTTYINYNKYDNNKNSEFSIFMEKFIGILDGDGYFDIGPQKQYNKNLNNKPKSTIRIRLVINLHFKDKDLLNFIVANLGVGKIDYSKSKSQYRLILYKKDILKSIYPYLNLNNNYRERRNYYKI